MCFDAKVDVYVCRFPPLTTIVAGRLFSMADRSSRAVFVGSSTVPERVRPLVGRKDSKVIA